MNKILFGVFLSFIFCCVSFVDAEEILNFDANIVINEDATIDVTETILYDFGNLNKHGIYRDIPVKYKTDTGNNTSIDLNNINVVGKNGNDLTFVVSKEGENKRIKIGDADKFVTDEQTYIISYTVDGAINYFDNHDELYWDVIGDDWLVHMKNASATVYAPNITKTICFAGPYGSIESCDDKVEERDYVKFTHKGIEAGDNMTIAVGMQLGIINKPTMTDKLIKFTVNNWILIVPFAVFFLMWNHWKKSGKDPEGRGTIIPFYEAPDQLSPAEVGMIVDEKVHSQDISALMINLAVKGYIHIRKQDDEYIFIKSGNSNCSLVSEEQMLYDSIFKGGKNEVKVSSLKNKFYVDFARIKQDITKTIIQKGYYAESPQYTRIKYIIAGLFMFGGALNFGIFFGVVGVISLCVASFFILIFGYFMPRRTKKGAIAREQILGLKMYMNTAEKDRIDFHNAPEKNPKHFEKLLPYAMALGVEKKWAKQFENIYNNSPEWYEGTDTFTAATFANNMHSLGTSTASAMTSQPSSASSGGSGGGSGGGGGGSW